MCVLTAVSTGDLSEDTYRVPVRDDNRMKIELNITLVLRVRIQNVGRKSA
jgi:hypothetical protein